jgi:hypothetical protein
LRVRLRQDLKKMNRNKLSVISSSQKAAELSSVAGRFCCLSLHCSVIREQILSNAG